MAAERRMTQYRRLYAALLRLYPEPFRRRFAEGMEQTFHDLCRERLAGGGSVSGFALGLYAETLAGILRERIALIMPSRKTVLRLALITASILAVPLVAMQFSEEVDWTLFDFLAMGVMIFGTGMLFETIAGRMRNSTYRMATGLAVGTGFFIIWINLAVGIIGSEDNPANVLYLGVLMVAGVGAALARLRPAGMARTMFATALAQALVPLVALAIFRPLIDGEEAVAGLVRVLFLNAALALMFAGAGALYRHADAQGATDPGIPAQPSASR